jgi:hypothetical protein
MHTMSASRSGSIPRTLRILGRNLILLNYYYLCPSSPECTYCVEPPPQSIRCRSPGEGMTCTRCRLPFPGPSAYQKGETREGGKERLYHLLGCEHAPLALLGAEAPLAHCERLCLPDSVGLHGLLFWACFLLLSSSSFFAALASLQVTKSTFRPGDGTPRGKRIGSLGALLLYIGNIQHPNQRLKLTTRSLWH